MRLKTQMNRFALTVNNWTQEDLMALLAMPMAYHVIGFEKTQSGVSHLQVYIETDKNFKYVQKALPRAHIERARKSREANAIYCKKSGNFIENARHSLAVACTITENTQH